MIYVLFILHALNIYFTFALSRLSDFMTCCWVGGNFVFSVHGWWCVSGRTESRADDTWVVFVPHFVAAGSVEYIFWLTTWAYLLNDLVNDLVRYICHNIHFHLTFVLTVKSRTYLCTNFPFIPFFIIINLVRFSLSSFLMKLFSFLNRICPFFYPFSHFNKLRDMFFVHEISYFSSIFFFLKFFI